MKSEALRRGMTAQVWTQVIKESVVREVDVKTEDDGLRLDLGHGSLRWRHYLTSKPLIFRNTTLIALI